MMSLKSKKHILIEFFRNNGGIPKGAVSIDNDTGTIGNVMVNGCWYGTFDYTSKEFITLAE
ncbi:MAG: hypothetical protein ACI4J7_08850 [Ruminiclostridium sp.]